MRTVISQPYGRSAHSSTQSSNNQTSVSLTPRKMKTVLILMLAGALLGSPVPQDEDLPPMPYDFTNKVSEEGADPNGVYWTQDEAALEDNPGRVDGSYSVWLPDGRLMTVTYYIDGDSGFVPEITYTDNYQPTWTE